MKRPIGTLFAVLLASPAANDRGHIAPVDSSAAGPVGAIRLPAPAVPEGADRPRTIYVPVVRSELLSRHESLQLTEALARTIEERTPFKVVATAGQADLVFWGSFKTSNLPKK